MSLTSRPLDPPPSLWGSKYPRQPPSSLSCSSSLSSPSSPSSSSSPLSSPPLLPSPLPHLSSKYGLVPSWTARPDRSFLSLSRRRVSSLNRTRSPRRLAALGGGGGGGDGDGDECGILEPHRGQGLRLRPRGVGGLTDPRLSLLLLLFLGRYWDQGCDGGRPGSGSVCRCRCTCECRCRRWFRCG